VLGFFRRKKRKEGRSVQERNCILWQSVIVVPTGYHYAAIMTEATAAKHFNLPWFQRLCIAFVIYIYILVKNNFLKD